MMRQPIGIFDSGYGGLTILKEITAALPQYDYLYLGDNARAPYGDKDFDTVYRYTLQAVQWFFDQGCSLVILACNTASAKALRTIQQNDLSAIGMDKRVLGVIRPTSEVIGTFSPRGHVGVLGTQGTVQSGSYLMETRKFFPQVVVSQEACPEWVGLVENNLCHTPEANHFVKLHIDHILQKDPAIDTLLLACTHYPLLLMDTIKANTPKGINVVSQGAIVANSLADYLQKHPEMEKNCSKTGLRYFFTTGDSGDFDAHASLFYGQTITSSQLILG